MKVFFILLVSVALGISNLSFIEENKTVSTINYNNFKSINEIKVINNISEGSSLASSSVKPKQINNKTNNTNIPVKLNKSDKKFKFIVEYIKSHEGFRGKIYTCVGSNLKEKKFYTVGYGHVIKPNKSNYEKSLLNREISKKEGLSILYSDFEEAYNLVVKDKNIPTNLMKEEQKIALAHFVYALGIGTFRKSTLYKKIKLSSTVDDLISIPKSCFTAYSYVIYKDKKTGKRKKKFYKNLNKMRKYEYNLWVKQ